jgi:glycosyltransferase involved in cell wall biosynthesis
MLDGVEFCLLAERGALELQAVLLCESIRKFCGRYASAPVTVISPRADRRPSRRTQRRFAELGARYIELSLDSPTPEYGPSFRVLALSWRARRLGPSVLVQLDSDTIFLDEPDLDLGDYRAAARPVDMIGMCSTGPNDPREALWETMCRANDVSLNAMPSVRTTVEGRTVRASYNGGLIVARRDAYVEFEQCFHKIVAADVRPYRGAAMEMRTGAAIVSPKGFEMWGTSQAAISIALTKTQSAVRILDSSHNIPLHMFDSLDPLPSRIVHLHYHWIFADDSQPNPALDGRLPLTSCQRDWLRQRLPLTDGMPAAAETERASVSPRLVSFHHRLAGLTGHKYAEVLGLIPAARERGREFHLLMHQGADAPTRQAFPEGRAVLHDATFQMNLSFDERCADFVSMLGEHLDSLIRADDWLFVTTGTQCEVRGLVHWIGRMPEGQRPWIFTCFHSDRWNRYGAEERTRQIAEFQALAVDLARLDRDARGRLVIGAVTEALCAELSELLGVPTALVPMMMPPGAYVPLERKALGEATVAFVGGSRHEKGAHRLAAILDAVGRDDRVSFAVQLANELLSHEEFAELCRAMEAPNITAVHGAMEQSLYRSFIAKADILLLPYERTPYRKRPSAIFVEAASTGRPVVVPSGTWMSEQIEGARAAGIIYEGDDPQAIAAAVLVAIDRLPQLAAKAKDCTSYWQTKMQVGPVLDWFAAEIARRNESSVRTPFSRLIDFLRPRFRYVKEAR